MQKRRTGGKTGFSVTHGRTADQLVAFDPVSARACRPVSRTRSSLETRRWMESK